MHWTPTAADDLTDLIVFDGDCVLCSRWARWVHRRDREGRFKFVAIQSEAGLALARRFGVNPENPETNIVVRGGRAFFKLDTVSGILDALPRWRPATAALALIPRFARNWLYDRLASNRYAWFGRREQCLLEAGLGERIVERLSDLSR